MNLLALDLGKRIGVAYTDGDKIQSCFIDVTSEYHALIMLEDYIVLTNPAAVFYEHAAFQQGMAAQYWHSQRGILAALCQKHGRAYDGVAVKTIKLHITGNGNFGKPKKKSDEEYLMLPALRARGYNVTDHNEADALALLLYVIDTRLVEAGE